MKYKVVKSTEIGGGWKIQFPNGELSPETYYTKKGAENMIKGVFGSAGGVR